MQMTKVNCLCCGHFVDLSPAYDNYEGQIKCFGCGGILEVRLQDGELKAVRSVGYARPPLEEAEQTIGRRF